MNQRYRASDQMVSPQTGRRRADLTSTTAVRIAATLVSGVLFYFGTGLEPWAWCVWLAPLPLLVVVPRARGLTAFGMSAVAWLGGESALWQYFLGSLSLPVVPALLIIIGSAVLFGFVGVGFGALVRSGHPLVAAFMVPASWAAAEYVMSLAGPFGAWWSLAYTQVDVLPVVQVASVTGRWGITFLLLLVPATVAVLLNAGPRKAKVRVAVSSVVLVAVALGYGGWRMTTPSGDSSRVAAVTVEQSFLPVEITSEEGKNLVARFVAALQSPSLDGARVVVLPEKALATDAASLHLITDPLARIATQRDFDVVVGILLTEGEDAGVNQAIDLPANGAPVRYEKHHLIPGLESDLTPGEGTATIPGSDGRWGLAICFDLDFPQLLRDNRDIGVTAMFVPGWDFDTDAWLHSRKAVLGGVEYGLSLVRSARNGALTVSDPMGRVTAEARSADGPAVIVSTDLPAATAPTVYAQIGDLFAWACLAFLVFLALSAMTRTRHADRARRRSEG